MSTTTNSIDALTAFKATLKDEDISDEILLAFAALEKALIKPAPEAEITMNNADAAADDLAAEAEVAAVLSEVEVEATEFAAVGEYAPVDVAAAAVATTNVLIQDAATPNVSEVQVATAEVAAANVSEEDSVSEVADADDEAGSITLDVTTPTPPPKVVPTTSEQSSPRRSLRLRLACQKAAAQGGNAIVSVTPSATGEGVHTHWHYPDNAVPAATTASPDGELSSDDGATLVGSSDDGDEKKGKRPFKRASAPSPSPYPPSPPPYVLVPSFKLTPSKKRARDSSSEEDSRASTDDGPARRTRSKVAFAAPPSPAPVGTRHRRRRAPTPGPRASHAPKTRSMSPSPSPPPPTILSSTTTSSTNTSSSSHPTTSTYPNPRPLVAEQSFHHASNFSIFCHPSFGSLDKQPVGKDALPPQYKYSKVPERIVNRKVVKEGEGGSWTAVKALAKQRDDATRERKLRKSRKLAPTSTAQVASTSRLPSPPPTPVSASGSGGKRAREDDDEEKEDDEEGRRTRARRESPSLGVVEVLTSVKPRTMSNDDTPQPKLKPLTREDLPPTPPLRNYARGVFHPLLALGFLTPWDLLAEHAAELKIRGCTPMARARNLWEQIRDRQPYLGSGPPFIPMLCDHFEQDSGAFKEGRGFGAD
ncbi:hypothetical protein Hypma_010982 [Hypsizygus marmoreus]|uniref:Uncharacterized protein n=1 Tax=Hypsizygus marmoreus TaxID=39966 RepID=A0A369JNV4_HYPMA|nr:hypothetical protein Hypma_010982 [Hypsizygus marmoreus]